MQREANARLMTSTSSVRRLSLSGGCLGLALATLASPVCAQTVRGIVVELGTERPVQLATVMMISESGDTVASALTDENGFYSVASADDGTFMLVVRALGYRARREGPLEMEDEDMRIVRFNLSPHAVRIEGIVVVADATEAWLARNGFYERMENERGYFLTPEDIATSDAFFTPELFRGGLDGRTYVNAMDVPWNASVSLRGITGGYCTPRVYVNGAFQFLEEGDGFSLDMAAPMDEIVAVEVYRGFRERPPIRYREPGVSPCGVLLFWTTGG